MLPGLDVLTPALLASICVAVLAGVVLHELTHWAVARVLGCPARIRLHSDGVPTRWVWAWDPHVEYEVPNEKGYWVERVVGLSPMLVGVSVAIVYVLTSGLPSGELAPAVGLGWAMYALNGGLADYSVHAAHGDGLQAEPPAVRQLLAAGGLIVCGFALNYLAHDIAGMLATGDRAYRTFVYLIGEGSVGLLAASLLAVWIAVSNIDGVPESHPIRRPLRSWLP